jgi:transmembrane sensor
MEFDETIDILIARVLTEEASAEDHEEFVRWMEASEENRRYFEQVRTIFEQSARVQTEKFDAHAAWEIFRRKIMPDQTAARGKVVAFPVWKAAASLLAFAVAGVFLFRLFSIPPSNEYVAVADDAVRQDTLPDGTAIWMNSHTGIRYAFDKRTKTHTVALEGEAFFEVDKEPDAVLIVTAGETFIRDIGTSFNVKAHPDSATVVVSVIEGIVRFYTAADEGVELRAGQKGVYDRRSKTFSSDRLEQNEFAYKTRVFVFNNQTLQQVVNSLNAVYRRTIRVDRSIERCRLTVSFEDESIEEIAAVIAETLGLTVEETDGVITLSGEACTE